MTMKNDVKFEEELICQFNIDMKNLTNFDHELCFMALQIDAKFEGKLTCTFNDDMRICQIFTG